MKDRLQKGFAALSMQPFLVSESFIIYLSSFLVLPYTMLEIRAFETVKVVDFSPKNFIKRYLKLAPKPTIVAFTWGFALSASASLRNKVLINIILLLRF